MRYRLAAAAALALWICAAPALAEVLIHDCLHLPAARLAESVRPLLSEDGGLTVDATANRLVIRDKAAVIADIRRVLERLDVEAPTLRVRVEPVDAGILEDVGADIHWTRHGAWRTAATAQRLTVRGRAAHYSSSAQAETRELRARSGEAFHIPVGRPVNHDRVSAAIVGRFGVAGKLDATAVQALLVVTPSLAGDRVVLTIQPTLVLARGTTLETQPLGDAISASAPPGERVYVGLDDADRSGIESVFFEAVGVSAEETSGGLVWSITVEPEPATKGTP